MTNQFIHLRAHSDYSLGQSIIKIKDLVNHALKSKMPALGLADIGNLFGSLEFSLECGKFGVQPIIGCVISIDYGLKDTRNPFQAKFANITLIAKNEPGYKNLLKIVSNSFFKKNTHELPHVQLEDLFKLSEGLILLCGGFDSPIAQFLTKNKENEAKKLITTLKKAFYDNLFIELQRSYNNTHIPLEKFLLQEAINQNIPIVATNSIYYLMPEQQEAQDALLCIANSRYTLEDDRKKATPDNSFKSSEEMQKIFSDLPEAINNTSLIAKKCSFLLEERKPLLPRFSKEIYSEKEELEKQVHKGLEKRIQNISDSKEREEYFQRLKYELSVINKMQFPGYFLIVSDLIKWSKAQGIPVGPGRGSGAGSLVAWALEIIDIDPIKFGLLFERFLNPDRVSIPDFDIDFCQERRDEVIEYVSNKFGKDKVAQIITFGKLQARAVLRDVGRVLHMPYGQIDKICKMIPHNPANPITLAQAIELDKELKASRKRDPEIDKLLTISLELEGVNRHVSTHAAGIVIADRPITEIVPLYQDDNSSMPIIQYSLKYAEKAGLVKFDFLGLKTLTVISMACNLIKAKGENIEINKIPLDDKKTYNLLSKGCTAGIFQFEGSGMREAIKQIKPDCIEDLIALGSLYRPGPMDNIPSYINRKHGYEKPDYIHPKLESILKETYGIIVYQEQVMEIAQVLAGYSLAEADLLRRAMGKKIKEEMEAQRSIFITGCEKHGLAREKAEEIFNLVDKFASYGFNKSHAAAYALISYQTAYLKANFPIEFLTASINSEIDNTDKIHLFCQEAKRIGIQVLLPDVNYSDTYFSIEGQNIRFGLSALKNVGQKITALLVKERNQNGYFKDIHDFTIRTAKYSINKRTFESLAKSGAFDSIHENRNQIFINVEILLKHANCILNQQNNNQLGLFDNLTSVDTNKLDLETIGDWNEKEKLNSEFESCGFYLSSHPLKEYADRLKQLNVVSSNVIEDFASSNSRNFFIAGVVSSKKVRSTNRGKYAFIQLSDEYGIIDLSVFDEQLLYKHADILTEGRVILCTASIRKDDAGIRIVAEKLYDIDSYMLNLEAYYTITIASTNFLDKIKKCLSSDGTVFINIALKLKEGHIVYFNHSPRLKTTWKKLELLKQIDNISLEER